MNKKAYWPVQFTRIALLLCIGSLFTNNLNGQCSCGTNLDVNPGIYAHYYTPAFDANGFVTSYRYQFQFPCMGDPLVSGEKYVYRIIYREKGTLGWTLANSSQSTIWNNNPFFPYLLIGIYGLEPCKKYELRVTCPEQDPFLGSNDLLESYLADEENNALGNVSRIWEICYSPIQTKPINNLMVSSVDMANNSALVKWDHLPGDATYNLSYKKKGTTTWTHLTTNQYEIQLTNLEACAEYNVQLSGTTNCCEAFHVSQFAYMDFVMTDCMSNIRAIDRVTGNSAHAVWTPIGPTPTDYQIEWWPVSAPAQKVTATATTAECFLTNLSPNSDYYLKVISNCGPQTCSGNSKIVKFHTNCELYEPNNSFQTATLVSFDANHSDGNISPLGDVDFYKFIPTVCQIEVKIDRPDFDEIVSGVGGLCSVITGHHYVLYDRDFHEVPKSPGYIKNGCEHNDTYHVIPGQEYYLEVKGATILDNLDCYTFNVFPCTQCDIFLNNSISGKDKIYAIPDIEYYQLNIGDYPIEWSVTGPANLINTQYPEICQLAFHGVGTVVLTAQITLCNGTVSTFQKEIIVTDECNVKGTYTKGNSNVPISEFGFNYVQNLNYTITLDIPDDVSFNVFLEEGAASWIISGKKIIVHQTISLAILKIVLSGGNCNGEDGIFTFIKQPSGNQAIHPIEWNLSPNPTSDILQITPVISAGIDPNTIPEALNIRLFNQNAFLEVYQNGNSKMPNSISMANLFPGNYTLQLLYGEHLQQFTVVKQ